jgi:hypothetical protein
MTFAEKLDLLMNVTNTTNSVLARSISMDPSFISRLRRGVRSPARNVNYIRMMAEYFNRCCNADYQKAALLEAMKSSFGNQPQETNSMVELLYKWLGEENGARTDSINGFLNDLSHFQFKKPAPAKAVDTDKPYCQAVSEVEEYYGTGGKQEAVLTFLSLVLQSKSPQTLLLYSDEDMGWLTENREFTLKWSNLLAQVLKSGHNIIIIHTVSRDFNEMLAAIREWVPLYMTGSIEPYYYPKIRDGLFRRTLFIAPDTAAVTSGSVGSKTNKAANFLFTNKNTVKALTEEYNELLSRCRLLMHIFTPFGNGDYLALLAEFEGEEKDTFVKTDTLTNVTMPPGVVKSILARIDSPAREHLLSYQQVRIDRFLDSLKRCRFTEIVSLPDQDKILAGKVLVNFSDMLNDSLLFYTPGEYRRHLKNIISLLKAYDNYHVHLTRNKHLDGSLVYVREDVGVLIGKTLPPSVVFAVNESNMTIAFWDYMNHLVNEKPQGKINREHTIAELEAVVARLNK